MPTAAQTSAAVAITMVPTRARVESVSTTNAVAIATRCTVCPLGYAR